MSAPRTAWILGSLVLAGCAAAAPPPSATDAARREASASGRDVHVDGREPTDRTVDAEAIRVGREVAEDVAKHPRVAPPAPEPEPPRGYFPSVVGANDSEAPGARDPGALCAELVRLTPPARDEEAKKDPMRCSVIAAPVAFQPRGAYRRLFGARIKGHGGSYKLLGVETPAGAFALPVAWDVDDPDDPGCPSILRPHAIERAFVERGILVVVVHQDRMSYGDEVGTLEILRHVDIAKLDGAALHLRSFDPAYLDVGHKSAPRRPAAAIAKARWVGFQAVHVTEDGSIPTSPKKS